MSNLVQYYVMKRAKHPITGEIIRGKASGGTKNANGTINKGATLWFPAPLTLPQEQPATGFNNGTLMSVTTPFTDQNRAQVDGEPWILHSVHFSLEDAVDAAKPVASSVGSENLKILKTIAHENIIKLA